MCMHGIRYVLTMECNTKYFYLRSLILYVIPCNSSHRKGTPPQLVQGASYYNVISTTYYTMLCVSIYALLSIPTLCRHSLHVTVDT